MKPGEMYATDRDDRTWFVTAVQERPGVTVARVIAGIEPNLEGGSGLLIVEEWTSWGSSDRWLRRCDDGLTRDFVARRISEAEPDSS